MKTPDWNALIAPTRQACRVVSSKKQVDIDRLFDALGDPTRRAIVDRLRGGPFSVSTLVGR